MVQVISSMVDIRTFCYAARLAAFSCPQKHWKALIFRGALMDIANLWIVDGVSLKLETTNEKKSRIFVSILVGTKTYHLWARNPCCQQ